MWCCVIFLRTHRRQHYFVNALRLFLSVVHIVLHIVSGKIVPSTKWDASGTDDDDDNDDDDDDDDDNDDDDDDDDDDNECL